jgi:plastocyanin
MSHPPRTPIWSWRAALAVAGVATVLLATGHAPASTARDVGIKDFKYAPQVLTVPVGATVTWTNHDEDPHTVTSATGAFTSTGLSNEETFAQTFTRPGTYPYFCALHPHMRATVVVQ